MERSKCAGDLCERLADLEQLYRLLALDAWHDEHAHAYERLARALSHVAHALAAEPALPEAAPVSAIAAFLARDAQEGTSPLREALRLLQRDYESLRPALVEAQIISGHADHELVAELLAQLSPNS